MNPLWNSGINFVQNTGYTQGNRCRVWSPATRKPTTLFQILANQAHTVQCKTCFEIHLLKFRAPHTQSSFLSHVANACLPSLHRFFFFFSVWKVCRVMGSEPVWTCFFLFGSWVMRSDQRDLTPSRAQSFQSKSWLVGRAQKGAGLTTRHAPPA